MPPSLPFGFRLVRLGITPAEFQKALSYPQGLVTDVLLHHTPHAFPDRTDYRRFVNQAADAMSVHPSCIVVRGSAYAGFSYTPRPAKVWRAFGEESDIDLAFVDPDRFNVLDSEILAYERKIDWNVADRKERAKVRNRQQSRAYYSYKFFDLPDVPFAQNYKQAVGQLAEVDIGGHKRVVNAFFYRDWWAVQQRSEHDLNELATGLFTEHLMNGEANPRIRPTYEDQDLVNGLPDHSDHS